MVRSWNAFLFLIVPCITTATRVLVTGATGRTGSLLYAQLKADSRVSTVRVCAV